MYLNAKAAHGLNPMTPMATHPSQVVVDSVDGRRVCDLASYLMSDRNQITIAGEVNDNMAFHICQQLRFLSSTPQEPVYAFIDSPGGSVTSGMSIYDTMNFIPNPIVTIVQGQACSMGAFLLSAGTKGLRFSLPSSRVMIHQPLGGFQGQASDIQIHAQEILTIKQKLNRILSANTGQTIETVEKDTDRDNFMDALAAKEYGLIDHVVATNVELVDIVTKHMESQKEAA